MAEYMLRRMLAEERIEGVEVASAGVAAVDGAPASEGTYLVALEHGLDLSPHRARQLTPAIANDADLILTMGWSHRTRAAALGIRERVHALGEYLGEEGPDAEVPDPFGGDLEDYRQTWVLLEDMLRELVLMIRDVRR